MVAAGFTHGDRQKPPFEVWVGPNVDLPVPSEIFIHLAVQAIWHSSNIEMA